MPARLPGSDLAEMFTGWENMTEEKSGGKDHSKIGKKKMWIFLNRLN
jgi:hypothetical protein